MDSEEVKKSIKFSGLSPDTPISHFESFLKKEFDNGVLAINHYGASAPGTGFIVFNCEQHVREAIALSPFYVESASRDVTLSAFPREWVDE